MNQNMVIQKQPITCHSFKVLRTRELTAWKKILLKKKKGYKKSFAQQESRRKGKPRELPTTVQKKRK